MMHSTQPDFSKYIGFTIGIGVGIIIGLIAQRMYDKKKNKNRREELTRAIENLSLEVGQLQNALLSHRSDVKATEVSRSSTSQIRSTKVVDEEDDDDDDIFFDFGPNKDEIDSFAGNQSQATEIHEHVKESEELRAGNDADREKSYELLMKLANKEYLLLLNKIHGCAKKFASEGISEQEGSYHTRIYLDNCDVLWRLGRAQYDMAMLSGKNGSQEKKVEFMRKSIKTCKKALEIDDRNAFAHKWYGIAVGNYCEFVGSQEKIKLGYEYKEHIEKAIELNPDDPSAYSLLGRWCYEVSMLPWYLRKVATAIFGEPPSSTVDEALYYAMKAEKLKPNFWKENSLLIAKCYYQKSDYSNAREWLKKARELPVNNEDDSVAQKEIDQLLQKV